SDFQHDIQRGGKSRRHLDAFTHERPKAGELKLERVNARRQKIETKSTLLVRNDVARAHHTWTGEIDSNAGYHGSRSVCHFPSDHAVLRPTRNGNQQAKEAQSYSQRPFPHRPSRLARETVQCFRFLLNLLRRSLYRLGNMWK